MPEVFASAAAWMACWRLTSYIVGTHGGLTCYAMVVTWRAEMFKIKKRPPIQKGWRENAACRQFDPELWSYPEGPFYLAKGICVEMCPVREDCLRSALQGKSKGTPEFGVTRGGRPFDGNRRRLCYLCRYPLVNGPYHGVCATCIKYKPCEATCGRLVKRCSDSTFCEVCRLRQAMEIIMGEDVA